MKEGRLSEKKQQADNVTVYIHIQRYADGSVDEGVFVEHGYWLGNKWRYA